MFKYLALAAMAVASVSADTCDVSGLTPLLSNENYDKCNSDSDGYAFTSGKIPTDAQAKAMCESDACKKMLSDVGEMDLNTDCEIPLGDGKTNLQTDIIDKVSSACDGGAKDAPVSAASSAASSTASAASSASASAASSASAPAASSSESSAASTASSSATTEAPASGDDTPAATPASTSAPTSTHAAC